MVEKNLQNHSDIEFNTDFYNEKNDPNGLMGSNINLVF